MTEKTYNTEYGIIHYWVNDIYDGNKKSLVFLPGLTADHRLFSKQTEYFCDSYNIFVWDAPGHGKSRPFRLEFELSDKAGWLHEILGNEGFRNPVIVGQSMGGYVGQAYMERFPGKLSGFISIDSAPLKKEYMKNWEIWLLKNCEPIYKMYPWKALIRDGAKGCAETEYGQNLMKEMIETYKGPKEYAHLTGHGYRMLANAIEKDLPYEITCPALLLCGEKDKAGESKIYNKKWTKKTGIPLIWIPEAGHNSNTDRPDLINEIIEKFVSENIK